MSYVLVDSMVGIVGKLMLWLAKLLVSDYCEGLVRKVLVWFKEYYEVEVSKDFVCDVSLCISCYVKEVESCWFYVMLEEVSFCGVSLVSISWDGVMVYFFDGLFGKFKCKLGYWEVMCGVISFYGYEGKLLYFIYLGVGV